MQPLEFVYWLRGFLEIADPQVITKEQIAIINDHLDLVLNKVTPNRPLNDIKSLDLKLQPIKETWFSSKIEQDIKHCTTNKPKLDMKPTIIKIANMPQNKELPLAVRPCCGYINSS